MLEVVRLGDFDKNKTRVAIVRRMRPLNGVSQNSILSPSNALLNKYLDLRNAGNWNEHTFETVYVPEFLKQMNSVQAKRELNALYQHMRNNPHDEIQLACFCPQEHLCHRSIIAGLMQGAGIPVKTKNNVDYSRFYDMYKNML